MLVSGFTFIKNAVQFSYPVAEAVQSILPLCHEVVVAVGDCTDGTRELIQSIDPLKIRIIDTVWDKRLQGGGAVLAAETEKAKKPVNKNATWLVYIQADECLHEADYPEINAAMQQWKDNDNVDGLLFNYKHFYGSYNYLGIASRWYRREVRIIKNKQHIFSYKDAQGFRKGANEKLQVKPLRASVYHYGWVKPPQTMRKKMLAMHALYHNHAAPQQVVEEQYDYSKDIDALQTFTGTHPQVMQQRINDTNWAFTHDPSFNNLKWKDQAKNLIEKYTGRRPFDYANYKLL